MTNQTPPPRRTRRPFGCAPCLIGLLALAAGCELEPTSPLAPEQATSSSQAAAPASPFYYYAGEPQDLIADSSQVVFSASGDVSVAELRAASRAADVEAFEIRALHDPGHFVLAAASPSDTDSVLSALRNAFSIPFASRTYRTESNGLPAIPLDRLNLVFDANASSAEKADVISRFGLELVLSMNPAAGQYWYEFGYPEESDPLEVAQQLYDDPAVEWADPVMLHPVVPASVPSDPYYSEQWYLKNDLYTWNGIPVDIAVEPVWEYATGGGVDVVVLDDGIDAIHEDLSIGSNSLGYDVTGGNGGPFDPGCLDNHGTQVAGIIAAQHNGLGGAGIAPAAVLHSARIFHYSHNTKCLEQTGTGDASTDSVARAIDWARDDAGGDVIVAAWGYAAPHDVIRSAVIRALTDGRAGKGTVFVAARGNNVSETWFPASLSSSDIPVVSVSAIDWQGNIPGYIDGPGTVDVVAPSGRTLGCDGGDDGLLNTDLMTPKEGCGSDGPGGDQDYTYFSGTSGATAEVAGIAALIIDRRNQDVSAGDVRALLRNTATGWGSSSYNGEGKVNAFEAVMRFRIQVTGPNLISEAGDYTWQAEIIGTETGTGSYEYSWYRRTHYIEELCEFVGPWVEVGGDSASYTSSENSAGYDFQLQVFVKDVDTGIETSTNYFKVYFENHPQCPY